MPLSENDAPRDPFQLFERWFAEAQAAGAAQPDAVALATAGSRGPSARMVLFKGVREGAFTFYSDYASRKGRDLVEDRRAALVFFWAPVRHQVRVSGTVTRMTRRASLAYFSTRPRGAQLSALASRQSRVVGSRELLERAVLELAARYAAGDVPLPQDWGGYLLRPRWIEFWEGRQDRLHDRLRYVRSGGGAWRIERLAP
jgi:pyridoxamine 5'-phosphate oxidase